MAGTSSSRSSPTPSSGRRAVARILGPRGLKGALRIELLTDWPERLAPGASVWPEGSTEALRVVGLDRGGRVPVIHVDGVATREDAEALTGRYLEAESPPLDEGTFYWEDLIGLRVESLGGRHIGQLSEVFRAGGNEVYRVTGEAGERLIPALRSVVRRIDLAAGLMVVTNDDAEEVR